MSWLYVATTLSNHLKMIARKRRIFWYITRKKCWFSTKKFSKSPIWLIIRLNIYYNSTNHPFPEPGIIGLIGPGNWFWNFQILIFFTKKTIFGKSKKLKLRWILEFLNSEQKWSFWSWKHNSTKFIFRVNSRFSESS